MSNYTVFGKATLAHQIERSKAGKRLFHTTGEFFGLASFTRWRDAYNWLEKNRVWYEAFDRFLIERVGRDEEY